MSGTLTWRASPDSARTGVIFDLTLTLLRSRYPDITLYQVGVASIPIPGILKYGDGDVSDQSERLRVNSINDEYLVASVSISHTYAHARRYGEAWWAEFEYCCRGKHLQNNRETVFSIRTSVDLSYNSSPTLPTLTSVTLVRSSLLQEFFYTAYQFEGHPLLYAFSEAYGSSQSGTPQGLEISYTTGHVTWNTSHVIPGSYSVQIVVVDAFTNIQVSKFSDHFC